MKKTFTKLAGGIMAASMILGTAGVAAPQVFADDTAQTTTTAISAVKADTFALTVTKNAKDKGTHTYTAYQIFSADVTNSKFVNVVWGDDVTQASMNAKAAEIAAAIGCAEADIKTGNDVDAVKLAEKIGTLSAAATVDQGETTAYTTGTDKDKAIALSKVLEQCVDKTKGTVIGDDTEVKTGYYLITDALTDSTTSKPGENVGSISKLILTPVMEDTDVTVKSSVPEVQKKVKDINDSTEKTLSDWKDSADYDGTDVIPYQLTATLGEGLENYKNYYLAFNDTMCEGLTFNPESVKIFVNGEEVEASLFNFSSADVTEGTYKGGKKYTWEQSNILAGATKKGSTDKVEIGSGSVIVIEYTATLNDKAVSGKVGNPNEVTLKYSSNPNDDQGGTPKETPEDKNIVFTYDVDVNKYCMENGEKKDLSGAEFSLYKVMKLKDGETAPANAPTVEGITLGTDEYLKKIDLTVSGAKFSAKQVDDGLYYVVEDKAPDGYNKLANPVIPFVVDAEHTDGDNPQLVQFNNQTDGFSYTVDTGLISTDVENKSGTQLPSTGGIGTTIFYIVGAAAAVTAIVLLTTRRRANKED